MGAIRHINSGSKDETIRLLKKIIAKLEKTEKKEQKRLTLKDVMKQTGYSKETIRKIRNKDRGIVWKKSKSIKGGIYFLNEQL